MIVVSIDFDIIMEPSIEFYNNFAGNRGRDLFRDPLLQGCNANLDTYKRLTIWLIQNINCDISFILNHQEIINFIPDNCDTLINIDHHHDLGYSDKEEPLKSDEIKLIVEMSGLICAAMLNKNMVEDAKQLISTLIPLNQRFQGNIKAKTNNHARLFWRLANVNYTLQELKPYRYA